jgi:hypothetical protein
VFPHKILILSVAIISLAVAFAQESQIQEPKAREPKVKVNVLNVCSPSADERKELSSALAKVPAQPAFSMDFEVSRGRSTLDPGTPIPGMPALPPGVVSAADWVRVRREFPAGTLFSNVQYSFSVDSKNMVETLVLRVRDPKDMLQLSIEDSASAVTSAAAMLSSITPVSRIRLERFGKPSVALARCSGEEDTPVTDQAAYEPIFHAASSIMERYRDALGARKMVPDELVRLGVGSSAAISTKAAAGKQKNP